MRHLFLFILINSFLFTRATVRTVSNYPTTIAQFNNIQAAVDASSSGDTVYVHGSNIMYAGFTITNKRLTIIGPGWAPNKSYLPLKATVQGMNIVGIACSGSEFQGLTFTSSVMISINPPDSIRFLRNQFSSSVHLTQTGVDYAGYIFQGNWFYNGTILAAPSSTFINCLFQNNIFYLTSGTSSVYGLTNSTNVLFDHNLWFGPGAGAVNCFSGDCRGLLLTNNIFVRRDAAANNSQSTFNNNITFNAGVNNPWSMNGNSNAGGNVENQDPLMAAQASVNTGANNPLLDFTIAAGPANNSGTDGKDMGLLFDINSPLNWTYSRMSNIPYIYNMNITNPTVSPGGTLNVQVEARKHH